PIVVADTTWIWAGASAVAQSANALRSSPVSRCPVKFAMTPQDVGSIVPLVTGGSYGAPFADGNVPPSTRPLVPLGAVPGGLMARRKPPPETSLPLLHVVLMVVKIGRAHV